MALVQTVCVVQSAQNILNLVEALKPAIAVAVGAGLIGRMLARRNASQLQLGRVVGRGGASVMEQTVIVAIDAFMVQGGVAVALDVNTIQEDAREQIVTVDATATT